MSFLGGWLLAFGIIFRTLRSVAGAEPPREAELLADGIAYAMNCAALLTVPGVLLLGVAALVFLAGTLQRG